MFEKIISFSVKNKLFVMLFVVLLIGTGIYSINKIPLDAVPDITNNQVQVVTVSPSSAPQEVEKFITYPLELALVNLPDVEEIRSISRFGLSVITVVFSEDIPTLHARQLVSEQILIASNEIPDGLGTPELMPITTGLGEIYQYTLQVEPGYEDQFDPMELRTIQDWIVKRRLSGIQGIIEVSSFGGYLKQYEVAIDPMSLRSFGLSIIDVYNALNINNQNSGGSYIEKNGMAYYIRTEGLATSFSEIENIVVAQTETRPILVKDVAKVGYGSAKRFGAMTKDGNGETVGGITLMYKGANSYEAIANVKVRIAEIQKMLPEGVHIEPYLDRSNLIDKAIATVSKNLIEGGLIVVFVLVLLLGNIRAGLIVASTIPLSMLFALSLMNFFGVSANLMSLGAIDFGIVVDGAVIITEGVLHVLFANYIGKNLTQKEFDGVIIKSSAAIYKSAAFGVLIILVVFIPILTLSGTEGKMFRPMAQTVSFAILGAFILSSTYVPVMSSLFLSKDIKVRVTLADRIMKVLRNFYKPTLQFALKRPLLIIGASITALALSIFTYSTMGAEFTPTLEEGDLAMQMALPPGSSLKQSISKSTEAEKILKSNFPEVLHVVSKIGTAEVPTDPMAIEDADIMVILDEKDNWTSATDRFELICLMEEKLSVIEGASFEFTQPIQLRFNELMTGAKSDVAIKIFGEDLNKLAQLANEVAGIVRPIQGAEDIKVEKTEGLPQLVVKYNRQQMALYGVAIEDLNTIVRSAYAGEVSGFVFEGERKFDLAVRLQKPDAENPDLSSLFIAGKNGQMVPISQLATLVNNLGPMQISRENTKRRINIGVNVRERDIATLVEEIKSTLNEKMSLPPGYYFEFGGEFEKLENATARLKVVVPIALFLIFILLFFAFKSTKYALLIFSAVPLSAIGGIYALYIRDMPFSISAGVGFIALFGVAVLNGIVLIGHFNELKAKGFDDIKSLVIEGALTRLRPVLMTALVASLGFLPMALSTNAGAEVQKPLATVVIGGLVSATLLTLVLLPVLYYLLEKRSKRKGIVNKSVAVSIILLLFTLSSQAQETWSLQQIENHVIAEHPLLKNAQLNKEKTALGKGQVWELAPLDASVQYGQINYDQNDFFLNINQDLGNVWNRIAEANRLKQQIQLNETDINLLQNGLVFKVEQAFAHWQYAKKALDVLINFKENLAETNRIANLQKEAGEISELDLGLFKLQLARLNVQINNMQIAVAEKEAEVRKVGFIPTNIVLSTTDFDNTNLLHENDLGKSFLSNLEQQQQMAQLNVSINKSLYAPSFSAGYFNQSLENQNGFSGVSIGIKAPIWWWANQSRVEQAKVSTLQVQNDISFQISLKQEQLNGLNKAFKETETQVNALETQLTEVAKINELSQLSLKKGEYDYLQFIQQQQILLDAQLSFLELKNKQSQLAFEINYLSK